MRRAPSLLFASAALAVLGAGLAFGAPGDTTLVSLTSAGVQSPTLPAGPAAVSANGRYVAFTSGAVPQLFVRDRAAGTTTLASANTAGNAASAAVDAEEVGNVQFAISGDGRYVVFASAADNLTPLDTDENKDVFRKNLVTGAVDLVSVNSAGQKANAGVFGDPDVSYDGNRVSFVSGTATNLFAGDGNGSSDVVVRDVAAGATLLAAQSGAGVLANGPTERSAISADGRIVAFEAPAGTFNLVPGDVLDKGNDAIVRNLEAGTTVAASDPAAATGSGFPDISGDGRYAVFETGQAYDAANDLNGAGNDVYRRDMATAAAPVLVSAKDGADAGSATAASGTRPAISADGSRVSFTSAAADLTGGDTNGVADVYTRDVGTKVTRRASLASNGTTPQSATASERSAIAGAGSLVTFVTTDDAATRLAANDTNLVADVLAKELAPTDTSPPAVQLSSVTPAAGGQAVVVTATDPSGIGSVTANGSALRPAAGATFSGTAPGGAGGALRVEALDGSANTATLLVPATTGVPTTPSRPRPRITLLRAKLVKGKIVVTMRLSTAARVRTQLLRRTVKIFRKAPKRRIVLRSVRAVTKNLNAGRRTVIVTPPKLRRAVRYVVRVRATSAAGVAIRTVAITVPRARP